MSNFQIYFYGFLSIMILMTLLWIISVRIKNASIVDPFWGFGFVVAVCTYFFLMESHTLRAIIVLILTIIWGSRLSVYLFVRNYRKEEDFRYQNFRESYGAERYWWFSFFQVFLLQGILMWLVSFALFSSQLHHPNKSINTIDIIAIVCWLIGFVFEAGGDFQMARFKGNRENKGKVLDTGFWKYTRHPNYFGDTLVWWGFGFFGLANGQYWSIISSIIMTFLLVKISGVRMLEKTLVETKPKYRDYVEKTSAFIPWFPKK